MFDYVMVDLHLPDVNGYDLIKVLLKLLDGLIFIIISGAETDPEAVKDLPVLQSLLKPVSRDDLSQLNIPIRNK
jgi:two-component SAPR family response regulator